MKISKKRNVGLSLSYIYFILNTVISIFMSAFIIRTVGKTDYGVYQSMSAFVSYLILLEFGTGTIMARNISLCRKSEKDDEDIQKNVSTIWSLTVILGIAICVVSFVFWLSIDMIYSKSMSPEEINLGKRIFVFAAINLLSAFLTQTLDGLILGFEYYSFAKTVSIIKLLIRTVLLIMLLTINPNIVLLVMVDAILAISAFLVSLFFCIIKIRVKFAFHYFDKAIFKLITPIAFAMLLQTIVNTANNSVDKFLISVMMSPEDVAVYSVAMAMFTMFSGVATLPATMYMPQVAGNMQNGLTGKDLTKTLIEPCRLNVLVTGVIAFGFFSVGQPFIKILYGLDYSEAWLYSVVIIFPTFVNLFNIVVINVIDVMRKRHVRSYILIITTAINIVLTIIGMKKIGMIGAALATGFSLVLQTVLLDVYYQKKIGLKIGFMIKESFKGILPCLVFASIMSIIVQCITDNMVIQFFTGGCVFVIVFAVLFLKIGVNGDEKSKLATHLKNYTNRNNKRGEL